MSQFFLYVPHYLGGDASPEGTEVEVVHQKVPYDGGDEGGPEEIALVKGINGLVGIPARDIVEVKEGTRYFFAPGTSLLDVLAESCPEVITFVEAITGANIDVRKSDLNHLEGKQYLLVLKDGHWSTHSK